jgi:hypothetical protein
MIGASSIRCLPCVPARKKTRAGRTIGAGQARSKQNSAFRSLAEQQSAAALFEFHALKLRKNQARKLRFPRRRSYGLT